MIAPPSRSGDAGFSLLEALVSLFIIGMLSTAGLAILSMTLDGRAHFDTAAERVADLERANSALKADLAQLVRRTSRDALGAQRSYVFAGGLDIPSRDGRSPILAFVRTGRENPGGIEARGSTAYVEYLLEDGNFIRRMAVRTDPTQETPVVETVLMHGVVRADIAFGAASGWRDSVVLSASAVNAAGFPDVVAVTLELAGVGEVRQLFLTGLAP